MSARDYLRVATKKLWHKGVFRDYSKLQADITYVLNYEKGLYMRVASNHRHKCRIGDENKLPYLQMLLYMNIFMETEARLHVDLN